MRTRMVVCLSLSVFFAGAAFFFFGRPGRLKKDLPEPVVLAPYDGFRGRLVSYRDYGEPENWIKVPFEDSASWGSETVMTYLVTCNGVRLQAWRPDPVTHNTFQRASADIPQPSWADAIDFSADIRVSDGKVIAFPEVSVTNYFLGGIAVVLLCGVWVVKLLAEFEPN